ncbi:hypothetical protein [Sphingomonas arenae]|uniref:hypothetical protein n=1 Tax=Sphingomonas arenae TaxID=2812555 RepID=UPI001967F035|nr:hypothetical protein [Sphingomonas arenae]
MSTAPATLCPHLAAALLPRTPEHRSRKSWDSLPASLGLLRQTGGVLQQLPPRAVHG